MSGKTPVTGADVRAFFAAKTKRISEERRGSLSRAQRDAATIIEFIIETYNPKRIYQWGSLVRTAHFTERSDIDIAIEGLDHPFDLHRIIDYAETVTSMPLDIVPIEEIAPEYAESIRSDGRLVYERS